MVDIQSISTGLRLAEDGIWYSSENQDVSYPPDGNEACFAIEDGSFWFKHRNSCIASIVRNFPPENEGTIFDIGGGNGYVSLGLANCRTQKFELSQRRLNRCLICRSNLTTETPN